MQILLFRACHKNPYGSFNWKISFYGFWSIIRMTCSCLCTLVGSPLFPIFGYQHLYSKPSSHCSFLLVEGVFSIFLRVVGWLQTSYIPKFWYKCALRLEPTYSHLTAQAFITGPSNSPNLYVSFKFPCPLFCLYFKISGNIVNYAYWWFQICYLLSSS